MGEHRIITRAQVHAALQSDPASEHSAHSMHSMAADVQAKAEYHGNKASDAEELTPEELVRWWSAAHVRPGAHVVVCAPRLHLRWHLLQTFLHPPSRPFDVFPVTHKM